MKLFIHCLAAIFTFLLFTSFAIEPENLQTAKETVIHYYDSGQYMKDLSAQINTAFAYLKDRVAQNKRAAEPKHLAIVLDIDETALSNYADMRKMDFGGTSSEIDQAIEQGHDKVIKPTLNLFNYAIAHGVDVFFVTGRNETERAITIRNLQQAGFHSWKNLYMKPNPYREKSVIPYKSTMRKQIIDQGYEIVLSVGDQKSDLAGGYEDLAVKLPNPYYYLP